MTKWKRAAVAVPITAGRVLNSEADCFMPEYFKLSTANFAQDWSNTALLSSADDWSQVASIVGYRGDDIIGSTGANPSNLTGDGTVTVDVNVNQTNPNTNSSGGVSEFEIANPVVALQDSGTVDAPSLVFHLDATGRENVVFAFNARDIDGSGDNAAQQLNRDGVTDLVLSLTGGGTVTMYGVATLGDVAIVDLHDTPATHSVGGWAVEAADGFDAMALVRMSGDHFLYGV